MSRHADRLGARRLSPRSRTACTSNSIRRRRRNRQRVRHRRRPEKEKTDGIQVRHRRVAERGKSTLFTALTQTAAAQAANYPSAPSSPTWARWACLTSGSTRSQRSPKASRSSPRGSPSSTSPVWCGSLEGRGLGNQFLANIREVDAIAHVVRCFEDGDVTHVEGRVDPIADIETIEDGADAPPISTRSKSA